MKRKVKKRRYRCETRTPIDLPSAPNEVWSMDFISDQLAIGHRIRGLSIVDIQRGY